MNKYEKFKSQVDELDVRMKTINNFFSAYSLASDSQLLIRQMLETIICQEEALRWYREVDNIKTNY